VTPRRFSTEQIDCGCGCGRKRLRYDDIGRERRFIHGHSGSHQDAPVQDAVLRELQRGPIKRADLLDRVAASCRTLSNVLLKLERRGLAVRVGWGVWRAA